MRKCVEGLGFHCCRVQVRIHYSEAQQKEFKAGPSSPQQSTSRRSDALKFAEKGLFRSEADAVPNQVGAGRASFPATEWECSRQLAIQSRSKSQEGEQL